MSCHSDNYYRTGRYALTPEYEVKGGFLRSKSPKEEFACFLMERALCWKDVGNYRQGVEAAAWAFTLEPTNLFYLNSLKQVLNDWRGKLHARQPKVFPRLQINAEVRRFPKSFPLDLEQDIQGLEALENLLNNKEHDHIWWAPLRRGENPRVPVVANVNFAPDCSCNIAFQFPRPPTYSMVFHNQTRF